jgi:hypothetical protein
VPASDPFASFAERSATPPCYPRTNQATPAELPTDPFASPSRRPAADLFGAPPVLASAGPTGQASPQRLPADPFAAAPVYPSAGTASPQRAPADPFGTASVYPSARAPSAPFAWTSAGGSGLDGQTTASATTQPADPFPAAPRPLGGAGASRDGQAKPAGAMGLPGGAGGRMAAIKSAEEIMKLFNSSTASDPFSSPTRGAGAAGVAASLGPVDLGPGLGGDGFAPNFGAQQSFSVGLAAQQAHGATGPPFPPASLNGQQQPPPFAW